MYQGLIAFIGVLYDEVDFSNVIDKTLSYIIYNILLIVDPSM